MLERQFRFVDGWLDKATKHLQDAEGYVESFDRASEVVEDAQVCIELSVKSVFTLLNIDYPPSHGAAFDKEAFMKIARQIQERGLMDRLKSQVLDQTVPLPRLLLLLNFWAGFYTIAKYGFQVGQFASARDLFSREEARLAVNHANECLNAARHLRFVGEDKLRELMVQ